MLRISEEKFISKWALPVERYSIAQDAFDYFQETIQPKESPETEKTPQNPDENSVNNPEKKTENPEKIPEEKEKKKNLFGNEAAANLTTLTIDMVVSTMVEFFANEDAGADDEEKENLREIWTAYFEHTGKKPSPEMLLILGNLSVYGPDILILLKVLTEKLMGIKKLKEQKQKAQKPEQKEPIKPPSFFKPKPKEAEANTEKNPEETLSKPEPKTFPKVEKINPTTITKTCSNCGRELMKNQVKFCSKKCNTEHKNSQI